MSEQHESTWRRVQATKARTRVATHAPSKRGIESLQRREEAFGFLFTSESSLNGTRALSVVKCVVKYAVGGKWRMGSRKKQVSFDSARDWQTRGIHTGKGGLTRTLSMTTGWFVKTSSNSMGYFKMSRRLFSGRHGVTLFRDDRFQLTSRHFSPVFHRVRVFFAFQPWTTPSPKS